MKDIIVAKDKKHLEELIKEHIKKYGNNCDLNHINVSKIKDMCYLFKSSNFNGNISKRDVINVENMEGMFYGSDFKGDISRWNVSNVKNFSCIFYGSDFNGDISRWNLKNDNINLFFASKFNGNISSRKILINTSKLLEEVYYSGILKHKQEYSFEKPYGKWNNLIYNYVKKNS